MAWSTKDIPDQRGRAAVVTGPGGLGFETGLALAGAGAEVTLAGRNPERGEAAAATIRAAAPGAAVRFERLDLASLSSIRAFAERMQDSQVRIDLLVNNAGVMALPTRKTTEDGFEMQVGTNHLGHFALTALLLPLLREGTLPRVVGVSSIAHRTGSIRFDDLNARRGYRPWTAYSQSKLAVLMFALELQRRSRAAGWGIVGNAAHPGLSRTELVANGPGAGIVLSAAGAVFGQSAAQGALPILFAATSPDAEGGGYYGPRGFFELSGAPGPAAISASASDAAAAARLWEMSEQLTGLSFGDAGSPGDPA